ncbi:MAG: gas vesicle protein [Devosia sp.]|nr:gas vesicle protein [Devosia sp.]
MAEAGVTEATAEAELTEAIAEAEVARAQLSRIAGLETGRTPATGISAAEIAEHAKAELARLTGLTADHVSAVRGDDDGWRVVVDLIELKRIPPSTDVLAAYEATYAPSGSLLGFRRIRRYFRDLMMDEQ